MDSAELILQLKKIVGNGVKKGEIEKAAGVGKNCLTGIMGGYRTAGKITFLRLMEYVKAYQRRKVVAVEDEEGNWTIDGKKVRLVWDAIDTEDLSKRVIELEAKEDQRNAIREKIKAIKAEKIPDHRNTAVGRSVWQNDQNKRIAELERELLAI
jgi:hypothetical protein